MQIVISFSDAALGEIIEDIFFMEKRLKPI